MATKTAASAKAKDKVVPPQKNQVALKKAASVPVTLADRMRRDAGKGVSNLQEDNLVPLIYVLQAGSPQVKKKDPAYIQGGEEGDIWLRNFPEPIVKSDDGIVVQPCYFGKVWIEWMPDRGGFAGRHAKKPADAKLTESDDPDKAPAWKLDNGNVVVETREFVVLVHAIGDKTLPNPVGYVIPFSSTGHTVARGWMQSMNMKTIDGAGGVAPSFAYKYRLTTEMKTNKKGSWYVIKVEDHEPVETVEQYDAGLKMHEAFASGAKQAAEYEAGAGAEGESGDNNADV